MAKKHSNTKPESTISKERGDVALQATWELCSILTALKEYAEVIKRYIKLRQDRIFTADGKTLH